jgi:hypothetical protein
MSILDDLVQGINKEFGKVQNKSQEMIQIYTLSSRMRALERKKATLLLEIGRLVYDKYQRDSEITEEALRDKTSEIVACETEIAVLQAEVEALQAAHDPNLSASQKSEAKAGYKATPGFTCPHCQAQANLQKSFCPSCGGSLEEARRAFNGDNGN